MDILRFTTAGSVDDGKSTLIGRLLFDANAIYQDHIEGLRNSSASPELLDFALLTDGLKAERERGITIDVAYRYFSTARRRFIIADTPGHEQYTRNMATGASTSDVAVVLIDARLGVLTQSKRHGFIASLLGIPRLVLAVNKMDSVDFAESRFTQIRDEYFAFAARLGFSEMTCIPVSALHGDNVVHQSERMPWFSGMPLLSYLENVFIDGDRNLIDLRFPVQRAVHASDFRGYSGQIQSGVIRVGDEVVVVGSGKRSRVRKIVNHVRDLDYAFPPMSVTLCFEDELDVGRGDMIAHPNNVPRTERALDAMVIWMNERPLEAGRKYLVKHGANTVPATATKVLYKVDPDTLHREESAVLSLNEIGRARFGLFRPVYVDEYRRNRANGNFILIDPSTNETVGAGMVTDRRSVSTENAPNREALLRQRPLTLWLTGLSGSGKSTLALKTEKRLLQAGFICTVLDGDNVRQGLNRDLGFSPEDRTENIRRVAEVARLFNDAGLIVLVAFISPYVQDREAARAIIGKEKFVEVYLSADVETCEQRDTKGLYAKARKGEIPEFTGVSAPYEPPGNPQLTLNTASRTLDSCVDDLLRIIQASIDV